MTTHETMTPEGRRQLIQLMLLAVGAAALAVLINRFPFPLLPGLSFFAGSIVTLLASYSRGPWIGGFVGLCGGYQISLVLGLPFPLPAVVGALEGIYTGWIFRRVPGRRLVGVTLSYWIPFGCLIHFLGSYYFLDHNLSAAYLFQIKAVMTGLLCAIAAELVLFCGVPVLHRIQGVRAGSTRLPLAEVISLVLTISVVLPVLVHTAVYTRRHRDDLLEKTAAGDQLAVAAVRDELSNLLDQWMHVLPAVESVLSSRPHYSREELSHLLKQTRRRSPELAAVSIAAVDGLEIASDPPDSGRGTAWTERFGSSLPRERGLLLSGLQTLPGGGKEPGVAIAGPLMSLDGRVLGYAAAWIRLETFQAVARRHVGTLEGVQLTLTDRRGQVIVDTSSHARASSAQRSSGEPQALTARSESGRVAVSAEAEHRPVAARVSRVPSWLTWGTVPASGWRVVFKRSSASFEQQMVSAYTESLFLILAITLVAYVVGRWIGGYLVQPLKSLEISAEKLARGELKHRPAISAVYSREVDALVSSFTRMSESLDASWATQRELIREISDHKQEWENTFDTIADGIFIFDDQGRLINTNRAAAELLSKQMMAAAPHLCCHVIAPLEGGKCPVHEALVSGRRLNAEAQDLVRAIPLLITVDPWWNTDGRVAGAVCSVRDNSELRLAQEVLRQKQELLARLVESAHDPIMMLDREGRLLWGNNGVCAVLGVDRDKLAGHRLAQWIHQEHRSCTVRQLRRAAEGIPCAFETVAIRSDGSERHLIMNCNAVLEGDGVSSTIIIAHDVSEQHEALQRSSMAEKMRALGQLASGVAHDFNNVLAVILGRAQLLRMKLQDQDLTRHLDVLEQAGADAAATVRRIQTFSRRDLADDFEMMDLNRLIRDSIEMTRTRWEDDAQLQGVDYEVHFVSEEDAWVHGCASELREVFVNLIINAVDAMKSGGRLRIWTVRTPEGVEAHFCDEGHGVPDSIKQKIFEPFFTTKGHTGTGLGLAVSYGIILRHKGRLLVESEPGQGTTFSILLPLSVPIADRAAPARSLSAASYRLLAVDDEAGVRDMVEEILKMYGHRVETACSGEEAVQKLASGTFDLVLTDLSMPGMGGWGLAEQVRERWPDTKILLATGYGSSIETDGERARLIDGIVEKPFDINGLLRQIDSVLTAAIAANAG